MAQSITLKIAGKEFSLRAETPENERLMRLAAQEVNQMLESYDSKYPNRSLEDKLAFVALNETVTKLLAKQQTKRIAAEGDQLEKDLANYLEKIDRNR